MKITFAALTLFICMSAFARDRIQEVSKTTFSFIPDVDQQVLAPLEEAKVHCDDYLNRYSDFFWKRTEKLDLAPTDVQLSWTVIAYGKPQPTDSKFFCELELQSMNAQIAFHYQESEIVSLGSAKQFVEDLNSQTGTVSLYDPISECWNGNATQIGYCAKVVTVSKK
jgi:hypothetical protein